MKTVEHEKKNETYYSLSDKIYLLEPQDAPLYVLVSKLNKSSYHNQKVECLEDKLYSSWDLTKCTHPESWKETWSGWSYCKICGKPMYYDFG